MKTYYYLFFLFTITYINVNAQKKQSNPVKSNLNYLDSLLDALDKKHESNISHLENDLTLIDSVRGKKILEENNIYECEHQFIINRVYVYKRRNELDTLLNGSKKKNLISDRNFTTLMQQKFRTLSGTEIKNGKYFGSSASIDSKSITVNISLKPFKEHEFYLLPTIAGSSTDGFVTVITGDKYSRTATGGFNFILSGNHNKSNFTYGARNRLHNDLKMIKNEFDNSVKQKDYKYYDDVRSKLVALLNDSTFAEIVKSYNIKLLEENILNKGQAQKKLTDYNSWIDTLEKSYIIPKGFAELDIKDQINMLVSLKSNRLEIAVKKKYLDEIDKKELKAQYIKDNLNWFGGSFKYNQGNYLIADPNSKTLTSSVRDEYITASLSYTFMSINQNGIRLYFSPTLNFKNAHNFNTNDQLHGQITQSYNIGSSTINKITKDFNFYEKVPNRLNNVSVEFPFALYSAKKLIGAEIALRGGFNDVNNDNLGVRIGALVPIGAGDKNQVVVEPLVKFSKLNQIENLWKDNFALGLNVSVTIPKSFFN